MYYLQPRKPFVVIIFLMIISFWATGQVTYKLTLDADKVTYRVFMKSSAAYVGTQARIGSAQVTIVVPHASTNPFVYGNLKGKTVTNTNTGSTSEMLWSSTRVDAPTENPTFDYISFGFNNSASPILFDITANQEIEILNFKNTGGCTGAVSLFENATDPFKSPNSVNSNPGNSMSIAGNGFGNVYQGNYGGAVNCQATAPDLKITPSGASTITAGSSYSLALSVMNIGTAATSGTYTVQTTLPVGVSYSAASGAGWACTPTSQSNGTTLINCQSSNTLSISSTSNLTLTLAAANTLANNSIVSITGNVSGGGDTNASNNNYSWTPTVINTSAPDLNAVMSGSASITAGVATNYTINVGNLGNAASSGSYSLNVSLPVGINYNSFSGTGWSVVSTAQSDGSTLLVAQSSTVINAGANAVPLVINVTPSASLIGGSTIVYNGSVSGGGDVTPANNSFTFSSTVTSAPKPIFNLSITGVNTILAGTQTTFTYAIANTGSVSTTGVYSLSITLPAGITYNSFTGTGWSVNSAPQSNGTTILTAQSSVVINAGANGNSLTINVTPQTTIPNNTTLSLINVLNGGGTTGSVNSTYNITIIQPQNPNLSISITGSSTVTSGSSGNYTIIVTNSGNAPTNGVYTVSTTLPAGVVYNSFTGAGWSVVATLQSNGTTLITATSSTIINAGNNGTPLILNITPNSSANASVSYVISSIISGAGNVGSNTSNFTITVIPNLKPDFTLSVVGQTNVMIGSASTLTFTVNNIGTSSASGSYTVSATLPIGTSYNTFSGTGWSVVATPQTNGTTLLTAQSSSIIGVGASSTPLIINYSVSNTIISNTSLIINANVSSSIDGNTSNNNASITIIAIANANVADLSVNISGATTVVPNTATNYTINVSNVGLGATSGTYSVLATLPAGLTYNSYSAGTWWTCQSAAQSNGTTAVSCQSTTPLPVGGSTTPIILNVTPSATLPANSSLTLFAQVAGGGDNVSSNNSFTFISTVSSVNTIKPDLTVLITGPSVVQLGGNVNYTFNVSNIGNAQTTGLYTLTTNVPSGMMFNTYTGNNWSCSGNTQIVCQSNVSIANAGAASPLVLNFVVGSNLSIGSNLTISTVVAGGGETNTNNNTATVNSVVQSNLSSSLNVVITGSSIISQNVATNYTINVTNNGSGNTSGIYYLTTYLPEGLTYNSSTGNGWSCTAINQMNGTTKLICQSSNVIAPGGQATPLIINVTPNVSLVNNTLIIINTDITGGGSNNTSTNFYNFYAQVSNTVDLEVTMGISNKTPLIGQTITYTMNLINKGPATASNINVLMSLPSSISNLIISEIFNGSSRTANYNISTGYWTVSSLKANETITLTITATVMQRGVFFATVEIMNANMLDSDSIYGNGNEIEDDLDRTCFTVPIIICAGESYRVSVPNNYTNIQWYRNGTPISGATSNSYTITQAGNYSFTSNVSCPKGGCCDIIVSQGNTPTITITQPTATCGSLNLTSVPVSINNSPTQIGLTYYQTQADAQAGTNPMLNTNVTIGGTYWVRYQAFGECSAIGSINVSFTSKPNLTVQSSMTLCAGTLFSSIPVYSNTTLLTSGLTYYLNQNDAQNATNPLTNLSITTNGTYWIRYQSPSGCFNVVSTTLTVSNNRPSTPIVADYTPSCPITTANLVMLQPANPSTVGGVFEWHTANNPSSPLVQNNTAVGSGIYYIFEKSTQQCYSEGDAVRVIILDCCKPNICVPFSISRN